MIAAAILVLVSVQHSAASHDGWTEEACFAVGAVLTGSGAAIVTLIASPIVAATRDNISGRQAAAGAAVGVAFAGGLGGLYALAVCNSGGSYIHVVVLGGLALAGGIGGPFLFRSKAQITKRVEINMTPTFDGGARARLAFRW